MPVKPRTTSDIATTITNTIIQRLEAGTAPWSPSWAVPGQGGRPLRHDGTPYSGINCLWLWCEADKAEYSSRYWMTARQAQQLGGQVIKDAAPSTSVYSSSFMKRNGPGLLPMGTNEGGARFIRFLKSYVVYNAGQIEGLPSYYYPRPGPSTPHAASQRRTEIDAFFAGIPACVRHGGHAAYFDPVNDRIQMPHVRSFKSMDAYASTRAHETCHWAGAPSRLNRTFGKKFGDKAYSFEELVAELGAGMICDDLGLPNELHDSHASYLAHWLTVLRADKTAIFLAAAKAEQAFAYLRGLAASADERRECPPADGTSGAAMAA